MSMFAAASDKPKLFPSPPWEESLDCPPPRGGRGAFAVFSTLSFAFPGSCLAGAQTALDPASLAGAGQMLFGLAVVLVVLVVCLWLLKRLSIPARGGGLLRVVAAAAVGPRERAVLLEAGGKVILLGVTSNNVRTLHVFERDELPLAAAPSTETPAATFASRLRRALKERRNAS
ncbi:MAG: flagellar biosynthetic protein FliO [Azoarcus sp.]|jgi:flagellar protein FliO/FliZ|nr:flagellar biosynthetic protein FliO [Azoarcus sp.]